MKEQYIIEAEKAARFEAQVFYEHCLVASQRLDIEKDWFIEVAFKELRKILKKNNFYGF